MKYKILAISLLLAGSVAMGDSGRHLTAQTIPAHDTETMTAHESRPIRKVLVMGDSMTGWLAERLNAYGNQNGFEVATIVWDGSTIAKWGASPRLASTIKSINPDLVMVSLGMNELFEQHPDTRLSGSLDKIKRAIGDREILWIGPPSWPGHDKGEVLNNWLAQQMGEKSFFRSYDLKLPRQSATNPHPTREGMVEWMDAVIKWIPAHTDLNFESLDHPTGAKMSRGKTFIYKKMKETL